MWRLSVLLLIALAAAVLSQRRCGSDVDCPAEGFCDLRTSGRCRCGVGFASWLDTCVPRRALGESCQVSTQCRAVVEHAVCSDEQRICGCRAGYRRDGDRCQFEYLVTEPTLPPAEDAELERMLGVSRAGRRRQLELHRQSFWRGLAVTGVLVALTFVVFTVAWLVSRRVRQRELEQAEAVPPKYALPPPPPPYSVSQSQDALGGSHDDMAAAVGYSQGGAMP